jgi:isoquinoline 1-oxidoreductase beta subunit
MGKRRLSRRAFLIGAGTLGAGLIVAFTVGPRLRSLNPFAVPDDPNAWLQIGGNGRVRLQVGKVEMGQGVPSALAQIVADELDVPLSAIDLVVGDTASAPSDQGTFGSISISSIYPVLRQAAAEARETLKGLAATRLSVEPAALRTRDGRVEPIGGGAGVSYSELAGERLRVVRVNAADRPGLLKPASQLHLIGTPVPRQDIPPKVRGAAQFGIDVRLPGMLHGKVLRPPVLGATLRSVDDSAARAITGVVAVVRDEQFVGVVAEREEQALAALNALAVDWEQPAQPLQMADIDALLDGQGPERELRMVGDVSAALASAATRIEARYSTPFAAHVTLEPQAAVADVRADGATVLAATQSPFMLRDEAAKLAGLRTEQVRVVTTYLGGGFGRKSIADAALEATRLSKAVGRPVRVVWSRTEEFRHGFLRPPTRHHLVGGLDAAGRAVAWQQDTRSGLVLFTFLPPLLRAVFGADFGATSGAEPPYHLPHQRVSFHQRELPVLTGSWRGLGAGPNCFATESFMDELAAAAGADPLQFRLDALGPEQTRQRRVLEAAAERADWKPHTAPSGRGQGIALGTYGDTHVAEVADVAVDRASGAVRVTRVVVAMDCGLAVNPQNVAAQAEGAVIMGASMALREQITVQDGKLAPADIQSYAPLRIGDAPDVEVVLIDTDGRPPSGVGEPPLMPAAAAIANAVFDAVGARVRDLPITPERVLAALP